MAKKVFVFVFVFVFGLLFILSNNLNAATDEEYFERFNATTRVDQEGRVSPDAFVPYYWGKNWFSGLGFLSRKRTDTDILEGFPESRQAISTDENRISLNVLSWQSSPGKSFNYSLGGEVEYYSIDKTEFGYFQLPAGLPSGGDWVSFDNKIDISIWSPNLKGDFRYGDEKYPFKIRANLTVSPFPALKVEQQTRIKPLIGTTGTSSSSKPQGIGYKANIDLLFNILGNKTFPQFGITASYEFLPLKYDLAILGVNTSDLSYFFKDSPIELEEITTFIGGNLIFGVNMPHGLRPAIGVGIEFIKTTEKPTKTSYTENNTLFTFGFEKRF